MHMHDSYDIPIYLGSYLNQHWISHFVSFNSLRLSDAYMHQ